MNIGQPTEYDTAEVMLKKSASSARRTAKVRGRRLHVPGSENQQLQCESIKMTDSSESFWSGALQGFSGPLLMAVKPRPITRGWTSTYVAERPVASLQRSMNSLGEAINEATQNILVRRGIVMKRLPEKRLDSKGKLKIVERVVIGRMDPNKDGKS